MENSTYLPLDGVTTTKLYFRVQYQDEIEWCTIVSPCSYEEIINEVTKLFPTLESVFTLQDEFGANLRPHFLEEYIRISSRGVLLKVREPQLHTFSSDSTLTNFSFNTENENCSDASSSVITETVGRILTSHKQCTITTDELREFIFNAPGGKEIFQCFNKFSTLNDEYRKKLVNISVNFLQRLFPDSCMPSSFSREQCAKAIIAIFPSLKDKGTPEGFEAFYDPVTKKGFLTTRLRTLLRKRNTFYSDISLPKRPKITVEHSETEENENEIKQAIEFVRHAETSQELSIQEKLKQSFEYRRKNDIYELFPRFFDTKGLISFEFSLRYPESENSFLHKWPQYFEKLIKIYLISVKNPILEIVSEEQNQSSATWNKATRGLLALLLLLPPTATGRTKTSRESGTSAQDYLLMFQKTEVPIKNVFKTRRSQQPFILAVGPNKTAIENYYAVFDENIVSTALVTGKVDIVYAIDILFKMFFIFNIQYPAPLKHFWEFLQDFIYNIHEGVTLTSRMRELRTKLYNI